MTFQQINQKRVIIQLGDPNSSVPWGSRERHTNFLLNIKKFFKCKTKIKKKKFKHAFTGIRTQVYRLTTWRHLLHLIT